MERERADCAVYAVALATQVPYEEVHAEYARRGRKKSQRTPTQITRKLLVGKARRVKFKRPCTLERFTREKPTGVYIVRMRGHLLVVTDGVPSDSTPRGARLLEYWKV